MNPVLETDRLILRPLAADDQDLAIALWSNPEVTRYVAERAMSREDIIKEMPLTLRRAAHGAIGIWCVLRKADNRKLGSCFLLPLPIETIDTDWSLVEGDALPDAPVELGYVFLPEAWGKGYATEASRRLIRFAFEQTPIDEIVAVTDPDNTVSQRVLRKVGFRDVASMRAYRETLPGFRLTASQWRGITA